MAYDLTKVNSYGTGALGVVSNQSGQFNSYANVTAVTANSITIGTPSTGIYETFSAGKEIMVHVSATNGTSTDMTYAGKYLVTKITAVNGSVLTIDKDPTTIIPSASLANYIVQAVTIAQFQSLTLSTASITPLVFSTTSKYGGLLLLKCSDTLTMSGGSINLIDKGIPAASTAYRPKTAQELQGTDDTDKYAGWENHITLRQFLLNAGDGAAMLIAKHFVQTGTASRIGGTTAGAQFGRGNAGGSTIALIAGDMTGFDPSIISKTKGSGQGLGRCYIASNTKLRNDEGLYAYDIISNPYRLMRTLNIKNYGDGSLGDVTNPTAPMNNYAKVTAISTDGKTITYSNKTATGMAPISVGALVMFHVSKHTDSADMSLLGKFILAKVLSDDGSSLILDTPITRIFDVTKLSKYNCQIISVAQFNNLTVSTNYSATTAWNDKNKTGGICAIAVKGMCDIANGKINVEGKGGGTAYAREGLAFIGNAQMADILPLGQGHGSVFLLTKNINGNSSSRIGATYSGTNLGGLGITGGGYNPCTGLDFCGSGSGTHGGKQGAHILILANQVDTFLLSAISSGGMGGSSFKYGWLAGNGGAGYSGAGGSGYNANAGGDGSYSGGASSAGYGSSSPPRGFFNGSYGPFGDSRYAAIGGYGSNAGTNNDEAAGGASGGGSAGWAFIYANNITAEDTTGTVI